MKRYYREYQIGQVARIIGVDVALYGDDAERDLPAARHPDASDAEISQRRTVRREPALVNRRALNWGADGDVHR